MLGRLVPSTPPPPLLPHPPPALFQPQASSDSYTCYPKLSRGPACLRPSRAEWGAERKPCSWGSPVVGRRGFKDPPILGPAILSWSRYFHHGLQRATCLSCPSAPSTAQAGHSPHPANAHWASVPPWFWVLPFLQPRHPGAYSGGKGNRTDNRFFFAGIWWEKSN